MRTASLLGMITLGVLARFLPHPPNMTPVGAIGLFSGAYLPHPWALIVPLIGMSISDLFLGFHKLIPYVYGSLAIYVLLGKTAKPSAKILPLWCLLGATQFFLITNFAVWLHGGFYALSWAGLLSCYTAGLPFYVNMLLGDLLFSVALFGGYTLAQKAYAYVTQRR
ncbi:MAG: DUF6580 family putative transport protein [Bacteroidia bacterium]